MFNDYYQGWIDNEAGLRYYSREVTVMVSLCLLHSGQYVQHTALCLIWRFVNGCC